MSTTRPISIAIHGGAGNIRPEFLSPEQVADYRQALDTALEQGYAILEKGGTSIDAVCAAVQCMEDNPLFNAGRGAVYNHEGKVEMDAAIMDGSTLTAGAVAGVMDVKNPILLARAIMDDGRHVFLSGAGAKEFAQEKQLVLEAPAYFETDIRREQWLAIKDSPFYQLDTQQDTKKLAYPPDKKFGTVGAVALDQFGNLAAATSTGGMCNKKYGRIGDSPVIGSGTYANNKTCAISCTGHGEFFLRYVVAYDIACLMEYGGLPLDAACHKVVQEKLKVAGGEGGLIAMDAQGNVSMPFNSAGMYRGAKHANGHKTLGIFNQELPLR